MADIPELSYGTVVGRFVAGVGDTADPGEAPDAAPMQGSVTFTATTPVIKVMGADPDPVTVFPQAIVCTLDEEGYLTYNDTQGVNLWATDDPDGNPVGWQWVVSFALTFGPKPVPYLGWNFELPAGTTVDLTAAAPLVIPSAGTIITKGEPGDSSYDIAVAAGYPGTLEDFEAGILGAANFVPPPGVDVQIFTNPNPITHNEWPEPVYNTTWNKPAGVSVVHVLAIGGGSGGGQGVTQGVATDQYRGGGGGGGGGKSEIILPASALTASVAIKVGWGTKGGDASSGGNSSDAGDSTFGTFIVAGGAKYASKSYGVNGGAGGAGGGGAVPGTAGQSGSAAQPIPGNTPHPKQWGNAGGAGGAGGGFDSNFGGLYRDGGKGQDVGPLAGGTGLNTGHGGSAVVGVPLGGGGGGGGSAFQNTNPASKGGNGGRYGAGGGGGAVARPGFAPGDGGDGSHGIVVVTSW